MLRKRIRTWHLFALHRVQKATIADGADPVKIRKVLMAEREGFSFGLSLQVMVKPVLARYYPVFERVTSDSDLRVQFL